MVYLFMNVVVIYLLFFSYYGISDICDLFFFIILCRFVGTEKNKINFVFKVQKPY